MMSFFAILFAFLLEQARPMSPGNWGHGVARAWVKWVDTNLDTGKGLHAGICWAAAVLAPGLLVAAIYALLWQFSVVLAFVWSTLVLYTTLGFRQFSHHFTEIRLALDAGDEALARTKLAQWQQMDVADLPRGELLRHVIETSILAAHRHVFGVLCVYSVGALLGLGPAGAVIYRLAEFVGRYWAARSVSVDHPVSAVLCEVAKRAWYLVDYVPARATALLFAVMGSFEDAVDLWRQHSQRGVADNDALILAATAGAVNVRLGGNKPKPLNPAGMPEGAAAGVPNPGREPEPAHLPQVVGLVWRSVVVWLALLALLTLARLLG